MEYRWRIPINVSVGVLVVLAGVVAASAQINEIEQRLAVSRGGMHATSQMIAGTQCTSLCSECFSLDTYAAVEPTNANLIAHTTANLESGALYLITIKGTYSVWASSWYVAPGQGFPENAPLFPTPGVTNGHTYADWEWLFGWYQPAEPQEPATVVALPEPFSFRGISLDGGKNWTQPVPIGGAGYNPAHLYRYLVVGQGAQAFFRRNDNPTYDNYGMFRICVQKLTLCGELTGMTVGQ